MTVYLACYDITDNSIRTAIARVLEEYGDRVQRSVFEIVLRSDSELAEVLERLRTEAEDELNIRLYRLCKSCRAVSHTLEGDAVALFPSTIIV